MPNETPPVASGSMGSAPELVENHIPIEDWPAVSKMLEGFGHPSLPASQALVGRTLDIEFTAGESRSFTFTSTMEVDCVSGKGVTARRSSATYRAVEVRPDIFYVDLFTGQGTHGHDVSFVFNAADGLVTLADSYMFDSKGEVRTTTDFQHGRVGGSGAIVERRRSDALVGLRIYYRYSPTEHYEHVYLSPGTFVWHCVRGGERGLADADQTMAFELTDDIVIFYWKETVMPVESFLVIDLRNNRSIGRMFCWDSPAMEPVHLPFDSQFTVLNRTTYPSE